VPSALPIMHAGRCPASALLLVCLAVLTAQSCSAFSLAFMRRRQAWLASCMLHTTCTAQLLNAQGTLNYGRSRASHDGLGPQRCLSLVHKCIKTFKPSTHTLTLHIMASQLCHARSGFAASNPGHERDDTCPMLDPESSVPVLLTLSASAGCRPVLLTKWLTK